MDRTPKYRTKGFLARSLALYQAARLATRMTSLSATDDGPIQPIERIASVRRARPIVPFTEDPDINAV